MTYYEFDSKGMDRAFLNGSPVTCKAALSTELIYSLQKGSKIVIRLSNKSKYMGVIKELVSNKDQSAGYFVVVRAS